MKLNPKIPCPHLSLPPGLNIILKCCASSPGAVQGYKGTVVRGCDQFITCCVSSFLLKWRTPHTFLVQSVFPPTRGSPPWTSPTRVLLTGCSSSWTALSWIPSKRCSRAAPAWVSCRSQVLPGACLSTGFPWGTSLWASRCSTLDLHGLQGSLCSTAWSTFCPSLFTSQCHLQSSLPHICSLLSLLCFFSPPF